MFQACGIVKVSRAERSVWIDPCKALVAKDAEIFFETQEVRSGYLVFSDNLLYCWWESAQGDPTSVTKTLGIRIASRTSTKEAVDEFRDEQIDLGETGHFHTIPPKHVTVHFLSKDGAEIRMFLTDLNGDLARLKEVGRSLGQNVLERVERLFPGSEDQIPKTNVPSPDPCGLISTSEIAQAFGLGATLPEPRSYEILQANGGVFGCDWDSDNGIDLSEVGIELGTTSANLPPGGERLRGLGDAAYLFPQQFRSHQVLFAEKDPGYSISVVKGDKHLFLYSLKQPHVSDEQLREALKQIATLAASRL